MHKIFISHTSALKIYRILRTTRRTHLLKQSNVSPKTNDVCKNKDVFAQHKLWDEISYQPEDFIVANKNFMHKTTNYKLHYSNLSYPNNSFLKLSSDVYIASPELLIYQMAKTLPFEKLILLIMELCGNYTFDVANDNKLITNTAAVCSTTKIYSFIEKIVKSKAKFSSDNKSIEAIKIATNNSASPQESRFYIILCAPHKYGGYNIKNMYMNKKVVLSNEAAQIACCKILYLDISNNQTKIALEYDSDEYHDNSYQNRKDKLRMNALRKDGWHVFAFVPGQLKNLQSLVNMAKMILRLNNQDTRIQSKSFYAKQKSLIRELYN